MKVFVVGRARGLVAAMAIAAVPFSGGASAQTTSSVTGPPVGAPAPSKPSPAKTTVRIPEGTEIRIAIDDGMSSKSATAGDTFAFRTTEAITLSDGTVLPAGYRGRGEVTDVEKKGMLGKPGILNIRMDYIKIGDTRLHLRRSSDTQGKSGVGTTVALAVIVSPLFLMHHGAEAVIPKGQAMTVFVDEDTAIPFPVAPPPTAQ